MHEVQIRKGGHTFLAQSILIDVYIYIVKSNPLVP